MPCSFERPNVGVGDHAATEHEHVVEIAGGEFLDHAGKQREVRARQQRQPDGVGVLLEHGLGDLLGGLVQPGVDHLETVVAQRPRDRLGAAVVPVESGLGDDDSVLALHELVDPIRSP